MLPLDLTLPQSLTALDCFLLLPLSFTSYATHLWNFQHPSEIVFDETYFGNFTNHYIKGEYFFDIHPPLAKLTLFAFMKLAGYKAEIDFAHGFGKPYESEYYVTFRLIAIVCSSLVPPLLFLALRVSMFSRTGAVVAAVIVTFDVSMIIEGKFILTDGILHFYTALHILICCYFMRFRPFTPKWKILLVATSMTLACAISCKYTAMGLCFFVGFCQMVQLMQIYPRLSRDFFDALFSRAGIICFPAVAVMVAIWAVHVILLPFPGYDMNSLGWQGNYTLVNDSWPADDWSARLQRPYLIERIFSINTQIQYANMLNYKPHPCMSRPIDWPLLTDVGVHFWHNVHGNRRVYCIGNLFSYALALAGVVMTVIPFKSQRWVTAIRFAVGWAVSYFPFFLVPRTMFLYHYLIPLMFGALSYGAALDMWFKNKKIRLVIALISIGLVIFGFMCYGRYAYGMPSTDLMYKMSPSVWFEGSKTRNEFVDRMTKLQNDYENSDTDHQELKSFKKIREAGNGDDL